MSSMSAMSFVHEHMHEGAQQQDGQWQPAECSSKVGAMLDAKIEDGERKENPEDPTRSEEHTSELQSLMRISYAVFCLKKKISTNNHKRKNYNKRNTPTTHSNVTDTEMSTPTQ